MCSLAFIHFCCWSKSPALHIWKSLCSSSLGRDGDSHPRADCCTLSVGALGAGTGGPKRCAGVRAEFCLRIKDWGKIKAKSEARLHQNEPGTSARGGWGKGRCCRVPGSCSALPASLASSMALDFYFLLKPHEGWDAKAQWRAGLQITRLSGCNDLRARCCKCFPICVPLRQAPQLCRAVPCRAAASRDLPGAGRTQLALQPALTGRGRGNPLLNSAHLLLHTEILQGKEGEGRRTGSVNPISIAAIPVGKCLVCFPRSLGKVRDLFLKGKAGDWAQLKPACSFCPVVVVGNSLSTSPGTEWDPPSPAFRSCVWPRGKAE